MPIQGSYVDIAKERKIVVTLDVAKYISALTNDAINIIEIYLLKKKSDDFFVLKTYIIKMKSQSHLIKWLKSNNGDKFTRSKTNEFI